VAPKTGVGQSHSTTYNVQCKIHQQRIGCSGKFGKVRGISKTERWVLKWWRKETMLFDDLTYLGSEFQTVGTTNKTVPVSASVLTLGANDKGKPDELSEFGC